MTARPIALITGATSGIGAEFARQLAARGNDLVIVARDAHRLQLSATELEQRYGIRVDVLPADLLSAPGLTAVEARLATDERPIDTLVNNAGFGLRKPFHVNNADDEQRMHDLLATVPLRLTHAALRQQLPRGQGQIINVASVAAYGPRGVYGASKRWLIEFSRWANVYYRSSGVTVTAVNPGFVHTELHERMGVSTEGIPSFMWVSAERVARIGLRHAARGRAVSTPTLRYRVIVALMRLLPARLSSAGRLREN